jgi:hypothetical protein
MADSQPSTTNIALACAIMAGVTGYFIGQAKSLGLFGGSPISEAPQKDGKAEEEEEEDESDESSDEDDTVPAEFPGHTEDCKLVLVVRTDLGMTKGLSLPNVLVFQHGADMLQARLERNAGTRHSPAISSFFAPRRTRIYSAAGNDQDR